MAVEFLVSCFRAFHFLIRDPLHSVARDFRSWPGLSGVEGFECDDVRPVWKRVVILGFGYPLGAGVAQVAISAVQHGLAKALG